MSGLRGATRSWGMQIDKAILWRSRRRGSIYNLPALSSLHGASSVWRRSPTQVRPYVSNPKMSNTKRAHTKMTFLDICPCVPCLSRVCPGSPRVPRCLFTGTVPHMMKFRGFSLARRAAWVVFAVAADRPRRPAKSKEDVDDAVATHRFEVQRRPNVRE